MNTSDIFNQDWSDDDLRLMRATSIENLGEHAPLGFTCDTCHLRRSCVFAFDGYNTGGDCLADK